MSKKTMETSKNKNVNHGKNGKGGAVAKKDRSWMIYVAIGVAAIVGIVLLAVFTGGSSTNVNGQNSPSQQTTVPDCCQ